MLPAITFLGHATVLVDLGGFRVLTDPVLLPRVVFLRRVAERHDPADHDRVDLVLISHLHHDHCDLPSLRHLGPAPTYVVPAGAGEWLRAKGFPRVVELAAGASHREDAEGDPVTVTAVTAIHDGRRPGSKLRAEAVGYLIERGPASVYFAGDTGLFDAMDDLRSMTATGEIDVALLPVWGWGPNLGPGHLHPHDAAEAVRRIRPKYAVPVHWGTLYPAGMGRFRPHLLHRPPHDFAEAVARSVVDTHVLVVQPGQRVPFEP